MGVFDFLHPQGVRDEKRDALVAQATVDGNTVHWGKKDFTAAEYAKFQENMKGLEVSDKQLAVLAAVHDGKPIPGSEVAKSPDNITTQQLADKATYDKDGNMHIGKLEVKADVAKDFAKVLREGTPDPEFAAMVQKASKDGCTIEGDHGGNSRASSTEKKVWWDPANVATDYHDGASMSARDVLKHEMNHEQRDPEITKVLTRIPDGTKTNMEEHLAIDSEHRNMPANQMQRDSHEANSLRKVVDDPNLAPQVSDNPQINASVSAVRDGKEGPAALKSTGQIKGKVEDIGVEVGQDGSRTNVLTMRDERTGNLTKVRFSDDQKLDIGTEGAAHNNPLKTLTKGDASDPHGVQKGDDITISFQPNQNEVSIQNRTQGYEKSVDAQAHVTAGREFDPKAVDKAPAGVGGRG